MMKKTIMIGVFLLALALGGCGTDGAGTFAREWAREREDMTHHTTGDYHADRDGRVEGYHAHTSDAGKAVRRAGEDMKDAGKDLGDAARKAGQSIGDAAEDALDEANNAARQHEEDARAAK